MGEIWRFCHVQNCFPNLKMIQASCKLQSIIAFDNEEQPSRTLFCSRFDIKPSSISAQISVLTITFQPSPSSAELKTTENNYGVELFPLLSPLWHDENMQKFSN
jgi:hypothetical protein